MYTLVYSINNEEHPETVYVNLTNSCTNSCIFCLRNQKDDVCGAEMFLPFYTALLFISNATPLQKKRG